MGCDIHTFAEVKKDGKWNFSGKIFKNQYYRKDEPTEVFEDGYEWNAEFTIHPYEGRNYDLFAILAGVRNGRGFAGVKTGEGFNPISNPKGFPSDASEEVTKEKISWDGDGHSHSFFTVKELLEFDWNQITLKQGCIPISEFEKLIKEGGAPNGWCGMISGNNIVVVEENEAEYLLKIGLDNSDKKGKDVYVIYRWSISYKDHCLNFLENTIPELQKLGSDENVRIVFWFDN